MCIKWRFLFAENCFVIKILVFLVNLNFKICDAITYIIVTASYNSDCFIRIQSSITMKLGQLLEQLIKNIFYFYL